MPSLAGDDYMVMDFIAKKTRKYIGSKKHKNEGNQLIIFKYVGYYHKSSDVEMYFYYQM
jgi:hypothetical protein